MCRCLVLDGHYNDINNEQRNAKEWNARVDCTRRREFDVPLVVGYRR